MAVMICALVLALSIVRSSDLDKIGEYELLHLDVDTDGVNPMLKFRAFSVDYTIELQPNNDLIPSTIHHTNGNPTIKSDLITNYGPNAANGRPTSAPTPSPVQPACFDITDCDNDVYNTRYTFTGDLWNKGYVYSAETIHGTRYLFKYSPSWWGIGE
eukprot:477061_1